MQYIDALFEAMEVRGLKPRIDFAANQTRIYVKRKLGLPLFDNTSRYNTNLLYFEYIDYTKARLPYQSGCVAKHTNFNIVSNDIDSALAAFTALKPLLRAVNNYKIATETELMSLF